MFLKKSAPRLKAQTRKMQFAHCLSLVEIVEVFDDAFTKLFITYLQQILIEVTVFTYYFTWIICLRFNATLERSHKLCIVLI